MTLDIGQAAVLGEHNRQGETLSGGSGVAIQPELDLEVTDDLLSYRRLTQAEVDALLAASHERALALPMPALGYRAIKRVLDAGLAAAGLVALCPLLAGVAVAVKATSPGPVIVCQPRYGRGGRVFSCYKFRTMKADTPSDVPTSVMRERPEVMTPVGPLLRSTSIDELPQLANVLKGDMALVGPRPMILTEYDQVLARDEYGANDIRPGITGWAQVNGRDALGVGEKARLDGEYRRNMSLLFDASILARTLGVVLSRRGYAGGGRRR